MDKVRVKVPASSANMGPGFDCIGIALGLHNSMTFRLGDSQDDNLINTAYQATLKEAGLRPRPVTIEMEKVGIPIARGLGSSAACIVAGVIAANVLHKLGMSQDDMLLKACEIEGHPDNVVPAFLGGMCVSVYEGSLDYIKVPVPEDLRFLAVIPDFSLSTKTAREVLPQKYDRADAVFNLGRTAMLVASMYSGKKDMLRRATEDRLHQPYRRGLISGFDRVVDAVRAEGSLAEYLSGSGPTIIAVTTTGASFRFKANVEARLSDLPKRWRCELLAPDIQGATWEKCQV